jgi:hypothetical protein
MSDDTPERVWIHGSDGVNVQTWTDEPWSGDDDSNAYVPADTLAAVTAERDALRNKVASMRRVGNTLSFAAQTTGGTAGRDAGLVAAIDAWERLAALTQKD